MVSTWRWLWESESEAGNGGSRRCLRGHSVWLVSEPRGVSSAAAVDGADAEARGATGSVPKETAAVPHLPGAGSNPSRCVSS